MMDFHESRKIEALLELIWIYVNDSSFRRTWVSEQEMIDLRAEYLLLDELNHYYWKNINKIGLNKTIESLEFMEINEIDTLTDFNSDINLMTLFKLQVLR